MTPEERNVLLDVATQLLKLLAEPSTVSPKHTRKKYTRKQQVQDFILANGPSKRTAIIVGTSIPEGTVSYVLNDAKMFMYDAETGCWSLK